MSFIHAIILGLVEGITEFLPVSSTGHLILFEHLLKIPDTDFVKSFDIIIQLGAILAVVVLYYKTLIVNFALIKKVLVAFLPTAVVGLTLYSFVKHHLLGNAGVVLYAVAIGGLFILLFEYWHARKDERVSDFNEISYQQAFVIGLFQSVSVIPGVSRSAATIIGGLALGIKRRTIVEFSFLLAIPTMAAASGLDLLKNYDIIFSGGNFGVLLIGFIVSFATAVMSIKFLLRFINTHKFTAFGIYRIVAAAVFWILLF